MAEETIVSVDEETKPVKEKEATQDEESILSEDVASVLFNEVSQGYRDWELKETKYRTRFPTPKEDASARIAYATAFNEALSKNLPTQKQMRKTLEEKGIWGDDEEREIVGIRDKIAQLETILSKKSPKDQSKTTRKLAGELLELRSKAIEASSQLTDFMANTIEALAEESKQAYYVSTCTELQDGTKVWETPEDFMNSRDSTLVNAATYQYITFTNGLAENYIEMLPEVQFMRAGVDA